LKQSEIGKSQAETRAKLETYKQKERVLKEAVDRLNQEMSEWDKYQGRQADEIAEKHNRIEHLKHKMGREQAR
jgi:hypothetical protein